VCWISRKSESVIVVLLNVFIMNVFLVVVIVDGWFW